MKKNILQKLKKNIYIIYKQDVDIIEKETEEFDKEKETKFIFENQIDLKKKCLKCDFQIPVVPTQIEK